MITNQTLSDSIRVAIAMIEKSQVLPTVQQVKLRRLELEVEALRQQVQHQHDRDEKSWLATQSDRTACNSNS